MGAIKAKGWGKFNEDLKAAAENFAPIKPVRPPALSLHLTFVYQICHFPLAPSVLSTCALWQLRFKGRRCQGGPSPSSTKNSGYLPKTSIPRYHYNRNIPTTSLPVATGENSAHSSYNTTSSCSPRLRCPRSRQGSFSKKFSRRAASAPAAWGRPRHAVTTLLAILLAGVSLLGSPM